uniref:Uncharacterized protein n=1 Tax=Octopus bimaculoides TaxID=37653 RepID=A0A0L8HT83_OCTBM
MIGIQSSEIFSSLARNDSVNFFFSLINCRLYQYGMSQTLNLFCCCHRFWHFKFCSNCF